MKDLYYFDKEFFKELITTGKCIRNGCEETCEIYEGCRRELLNVSKFSHIYPLLELSHNFQSRVKKVALDYLMLHYGEEEVFNILL